MTPRDRALAKASGRAARIAPDVAALVDDVSELPIDVQRQAVAVQEELDLLRHCLRLATLQQAIDGPRAAVAKKAK